MRAEMGIIDTIGLATTIIFALPLGIYGANALIDGELFLGGFAVVVAVLMVVLPNVLTTPTDLLSGLIERLVGAAVETPDDDADSR